MNRVDAENITLNEWMTNAINSINRLNADQAEFSTTIEKDSEKYVVTFSVHRVEEDEDE